MYLGCERAIVFIFLCAMLCLRAPLCQCAMLFMFLFIGFNEKRISPCLFCDSSLSLCFSLYPFLSPCFCSSLGKRDSRVD